MRTNVAMFDGVFADLYDSTLGSRDIDIPFWVRHLSPHETVMEIGAGAGRLAWPLLEAGVQYIGVEPAEAMLAIARRKLHDEHADHADHAQFIQGALPDFGWDGPAVDAVILPYNVFNYLEGMDERARGLRTLAQLLNPGGLLVIDSLVVSMHPIDYRFQGTFQARDGRLIHRYRADSWDPINLRQISVLEYLVDGPGQPERHTRILNTWQISDQEMTFLIREMGLELQAIYQDYTDTPYVGQPCQRQFVCQKPERAH